MSKFGPNTTKEFLALLWDLGVERLILEFLGGGDSGQIEDAYCYNPEGKLLAFELRENLPGLDETFYETLHRWFMPFVEKASNLNWCNNARGSGRVTLNLGGDEPAIILEITQLVEEYQDFYFSTQEIMRGEI